MPFGGLPLKRKHMETTESLKTKENKMGVMPIPKLLVSMSLPMVA